MNFWLAASSGSHTIFVGLFRCVFLWFFFLREGKLFCCCCSPVVCIVLCFCFVCSAQCSVLLFAVCSARENSRANNPRQRIEQQQNVSLSRVKYIRHKFHPLIACNVTLRWREDRKAHLLFVRFCLGFVWKIQRILWHVGVFLYVVMETDSIWFKHHLNLRYG